MKRSVIECQCEKREMKKRKYTEEKCVPKCQESQRCVQNWEKRDGPNWTKDLNNCRNEQ